jgi:DNA polymerase-1
MSKSTRQGFLPGLGKEAESSADAISPPAPAAVIDAVAGAAAAGDASKRQIALDLRGKTVYVIDANSLIFQVFHALPEMTSPRGEPVAAIFGFTRDILFLLEQRRPDYMFVAFDRPEETFRHGLLPTYKGTRSEMPADLVPQFPAIRRVLDAFGLPVLDLAGYEADDVLATIAHQAATAEGECFLVTADKDCRQLISERVRIFNIRKNEVYDAAALQADWGIRPEQVVDFQALVGDAVDNVPGVPLIGPKIARELLLKFGSLDALLEQAHTLPAGKRKENLLAGREQALLSRRLVALDREAPLAIDWNAGQVKAPDAGQLAALCTEFGFRSLAQKFSGQSPPQRRFEQPPGASQPTGAAQQAHAVPKPPALDYRVVDTPEKLDAFVGELRVQRQIAIDTETTHLWPRWAEIVGYSFSWEDGVAYYLPVRAPAGEPRLDPAATIEALRPVLEDPDVIKVGQNLKYDMIVLRTAGVKLAGLGFDTMVASYLLDAGERNHNLDELAARYLNHATTKISQLIGAGKQQRRMDEVPVAQIAHYAAEDADVTWRLRAPLARRLSEDQLESLFTSLEVPLVEVLSELEFNGIRIDTALLATLSQRFGAQLTRLEAEIYELAGHPFNIGSPKQMQKVLFEEQKLPVLKRTKTGGSTDADVLEELARLHPLPAKIMEFRQYAKLKSTYVDALPLMVHPETGRVHTAFNQVVAATGRLSSSDPNLQNIPVRSESGRAIRGAFLPGPPGWHLLAADYSQIELRVLAHYSGDQALCAAFARDEDIHARVASQVYGVPLSEVTADMRRGAKAVNFGVIYGQSPFGLAKTLDIDQADAARFINAYFDQYPGVENFLESVLVDCAKNGYVNTILGRRRAIRGVRVGAGRQRNLPERTAINTVIQGSAADLIKLAMINIHRRLRSTGLSARMVLQIHDELVFEVPPDELEPLAGLVREEMIGAVPLMVPLKVDVKTGLNWADCEPWQ